MTLEQTRQLGIEFERRVQTMIPEKEYTDKLDTETIYSYLNLYQDKYVNDIYRSLDGMQSGTKVQSHFESVLLALLKEVELSVADGENHTITDPNGVTVSTGRSVTYTFNEDVPDFRMYVRSVSKVSSTFSFKGGSNSGWRGIRIIPNQLVSLTDVWKLLETPNNSLRILRYPAAVITPNNTLTVIYDQYTTPTSVRLVYYKQPIHFSIMNSQECELPMAAFDDLVSGAVDLYVQYVAGAEAKRRQQQEAALKRAREDQRDARRSGGNQDEQQ